MVIHSNATTYRWHKSDNLMRSDHGWFISTIWIIILCVLTNKFCFSFEIYDRSWHVYYWSTMLHDSQRKKWVEVLIHRWSRYRRITMTPSVFTCRYKVWRNKPSFKWLLFEITSSRFYKFLIKQKIAQLQNFLTTS